MKNFTVGCHDKAARFIQPCPELGYKFILIIKLQVLL